MLTYLAHYFVVLQNAPTDIDAVIVPVRSRHLLVDICVYSCHVQSFALVAVYLHLFNIGAAVAIACRWMAISYTCNALRLTRRSVRRRSESESRKRSRGKGLVAQQAEVYQELATIVAGRKKVRSRSGGSFRFMESLNLATTILQPRPLITFLITPTVWFTAWTGLAYKSSHLQLSLF